MPHVTACHRPQAVAALLAGANNVLANDLRAALAAKLALGPSRLLAAAPASAGGDPSAAPGSTPQAGASGTGIAGGAGGAAAPAPRDHAAAINNADVASDYAMKLGQELSG